MSWSYSHDPQRWPLLAIVGLTCVLGAYSWRRHREPGALPFAVACLFATLWALGSLLEISAADPSAKVGWYSFKAVWLLPTVCAISGFVLQYAGLGRWLTRQLVLWLFVLPSVLFAVLVVTNGSHHAVWPELAVAASVYAPSAGVVGWAALGYHTMLGLFNLVVLVRLFLLSTQHRPPVGLMIVGQLVARVAFSFEIVGHQSFLTADPEIAAVGLPFSLYAIALFGFHVFDPVPQARAAAIEQMREAMLVLDPQERLVYANPAAERLLGKSLATLQGRRGSDLLPPGALPANGGEPGWSTSFRLGSRDAGRDFAVTATALTDSIGQPLGRMLLARDVTHEHRAQAYLLDQERALAALRERELLARELHDSVGQVLGYVSMQTQAAHKWLRDDNVPRATVLLNRLTEVAQQAHDDIREAILALKAARPAGWSFLANLREYAKDFERQYGITTEVTTSEKVSAEPFEPGTGVQALRVIQEAMSNARKHGRARTIGIHIENEGMTARITVSDDGQGMTSATDRGPSTGHFGISFMRERMAEVGGSLDVSSQPGEGTRVVLRVPIYLSQEVPHEGIADR
jgi:PAS domain S-box-containing protein